MQVRGAACQAHGCRGGVCSVVLAKTSWVDCDVIACQGLALVGRPRRAGGWHLGDVPSPPSWRCESGLPRAHACSAPDGLTGHRVLAGGSGPAPQSMQTASAPEGKAGNAEVAGDDPSLLVVAPGPLTVLPAAPLKGIPKQAPFRSPTTPSVFSPAGNRTPIPPSRTPLRKERGVKVGPPLPRGVWPPGWPRAHAVAEGGLLCLGSCSTFPSWTWWVPAEKPRGGGRRWVRGRGHGRGGRWGFLFSPPGGLFLVSPGPFVSQHGQF